MIQILMYAAIILAVYSISLLEKGLDKTIVVEEREKVWGVLAVFGSCLGLVIGLVIGLLL